MTTQAPPAEQPSPGLVRVTFDAGGRGCSVDSNPQSFKLSESEPDRSFTVRWRIIDRLNTSDDYDVQIANVVPCDRAQVPKGYEFVSEPVTNADDLVHEWLWRFTRHKDAPKSIPRPLGLKQRILYDIFFSYTPKLVDLLLPGSPPSLRQVIGLDPSMVLPPKKSGGGTIPPGDPPGSPPAGD